MKLNMDKEDPNKVIILIEQMSERFPADSVIKLNIHGMPKGMSISILRAAYIRSILPPTINVSIFMLSDKKHY